MANTFDEQARERFTKSIAFMRKAEALLEDDLIYRSALADAVSAIKNMLQGYLLLKVARTPQSAVTHAWQEIAVSNRMPELITACGEAGLDLRGVAVEIKRLNNERNSRTHDDPERAIDPEEAEKAIATARLIQKRIKLAIEGKTETRSVTAMAAQVAQVARAAASGQLKMPATSQRPTVTATQTRQQAVESILPAEATLTVKPVKPLPAPVTPDAPADGSAPLATPEHARGAAPDAAAASGRDGAAETAPVDTEDDEPAERDGATDTDELIALPPPSRRKRRRTGNALLRGLVAALLLIVGAAAGAGLMYPVASGRAPGWLSFATALLPATPIATVVPAATAEAVSGEQLLGSVVVTTPVCAQGMVRITLDNGGATPASWAVGGESVTAVALSATPVATAQVVRAQTGVLAPNGSVTVYVAASGTSGVQRITVMTSEGTAQVIAPSC